MSTQQHAFKKYGTGGGARASENEIKKTKAVGGVTTKAFHTHKSARARATTARSIPLAQPTSQRASYTAKTQRKQDARTCVILRRDSTSNVIQYRYARRLPHFLFLPFSWVLSPLSNERTIDRSIDSHNLSCSQSQSVSRPKQARGNHGQPGEGRPKI